MGLSFHDEKSMVETLRFAPNNLNPVPENGSVDEEEEEEEERRYNDFDIKSSDHSDSDICMVERKDSSTHTKG